MIYPPATRRMDVVPRGPGEAVGWRCQIAAGATYLPSLPRVLAHLGHIGREVEALGLLSLPVAF